MGFRLPLEKTFPSIYRIFIASQNTNRWRIIESQPQDAGVMFFSLGGAFLLSLAIASPFSVMYIQRYMAPKI